jgi:hypothetical protein
MIARGDEGEFEISWRFMAAMLGIVAVMLGAAWIVGREITADAVIAATKVGAFDNQIRINTDRLDKLELFEREVLGHDGNTTAELAIMKDRIRQLENWQQAMRRGDTK